MRLRRIISKIIVLPIVRWHMSRKIIGWYILREWKNKGKPVPPPHVVKQFVIKEYQSKYNISVLVETGTFMGDMVYAQKDVFERIISIELGQKLFEDAVKRFSKYNHIQILHGDSGKVLQRVVPELKKKVIFWLDGHYSEGITAKGEKECPIYEELDAIFKNDLGHILLIDDARCFTGERDYPTIKELEEFIKSKNSKYRIEVKDDIIRVTIN